jgi:hypothetical protein
MKFSGKIPKFLETMSEFLLDIKFPPFFKPNLQNKEDECVK